MSSTIRHVVGLALLALGTAAPAAAANYPLELTNIRAGAPNQRVARAYPGIEYNVRAQVIGGAYPYIFSLSNAPAGMTIDARGTIVWTNPQANATPTITIRDQEGTVITTTWTIAVSTNAFKFVDAVSGRNASGNGCSSSCGTGTATNPWRTLTDVYVAGQGTDIVYFRNGTYDVGTIPRGGAGGAWERVEFQGSVKPVMWVAYPGHRPTIDFARGPLIRMYAMANSHDPYIDGFRTTNTEILGFQFEGAPTVRNMDMRDIIVGGDGSNSSFIMTLGRGGGPVLYGAVQDSTFTGLNQSVYACALKMYLADKFLIEDSVFTNMRDAIHLKGDVRRWTVRGNTLSNISVVAIGGNMHGADTIPTAQGEILFNNAQSSSTALDINQDGMALQVWVYRNTLRGRVQVRNTDGSDGPFYIQRNVIINNDSGTPAGSHVYYSNVSAPTRVIQTENLVGSPSAGIVDSAGNLTAAYSSWIGSRGHMRSGATSEGPTSSAPQPPTNLRLIQ